MFERDRRFKIMLFFSISELEHDYPDIETNYKSWIQWKEKKKSRLVLTNLFSTKLIFPTLSFRVLVLFPSIRYQSISVIYKMTI